MTSNVIAGVFGSVGAAQQARLRLLEAGVAEERIALSADLSDDGTAAEAPGQPYTNQPGQAASEELIEACTDAAHAGGCVLCVEQRAGARGDDESVKRIMRECGAQSAPPRQH